MRGKNIQVFLIDGNASGPIKCTLANWTGIAFKIPRTELDSCKARSEFKQSGIYFLFGVTDDTGENVVYVGQANARKNGEGILNRLHEHARSADNEDYWTEVIVFTTSNNSFGATEISYLENRFCVLAREAKRYEVKNGNEPSQGNITEEKESELEEYIENSRIIMGVLGHKVFEKVVEQPSEIECAAPIINTEEKLYFNSPKLKASGIRTSEGFVVFKGSVIADKIQNSCPPVAKNARVKYKDRIDQNNTLTEDLLFSSPSAAAGFVSGTSQSGNEMWKTSDGIKLKDLNK